MKIIKDIDAEMHWRIIQTHTQIIQTHEHLFKTYENHKKRRTHKYQSHTKHIRKL